MTVLTREFDKATVGIEWLEEYHRDIMLERAQVEKLLETKGWKLFVEFIDSNSETLQKATHGAVFQNFGDVFSDQYAKGKSAGLRDAPKLMTSILALYADAMDEVQRLIQEKQNAGRHTDSNSYPEPTSSGDGDPELPLSGPAADLVAP